MTYYKYPSTPHLPRSSGRTHDDRVLRSTQHFIGKKVVITRKMDGENSTLYFDTFHARSIDSRHHPSRDWLAAFHAQISMHIPQGWRICGENLYAQHSIIYHDLPSYFMGFSVWTDQNISLSWDDTLDFFSRLNVEPVPVLYSGIFDEGVINHLIDHWDSTTHEGFVIRLADAIPFDQFHVSFGKWVRPQHVQTNKHWMHQAVIPNKLAKKGT